MANKKNWYIITVHYHHNNPTPEWYWNVQARSEKEAVLEGYKILIQHLLENDDADVPDLTPILECKEMTVAVREYDGTDEDDTVDIVIWNIYDERDGQNHGAGYGTSIAVTDKYTNVWFNVEKRTKSKESLSKAISGYKYNFDKLPTKLLSELVEHLVKVQSKEDVKNDYRRKIEKLVNTAPDHFSGGELVAYIKRLKGMEPRQLIKEFNRTFKE